MREFGHFIGRIDRLADQLDQTCCTDRQAQSAEHFVQAASDIRESQQARARRLQGFTGLVDRRD